MSVINFNSVVTAIIAATLVTVAVVSGYSDSNTKGPLTPEFVIVGNDNQKDGLGDETNIEFGSGGGVNAGILDRLSTREDS